VSAAEANSITLATQHRKTDGSIPTPTPAAVGASAEPLASAIPTRREEKREEKRREKREEKREEEENVKFLEPHPYSHALRILTLHGLSIAHHFSVTYGKTLRGNEKNICLKFYS
jgi:hypothetical protein